ncbi:hypothetical protein Peur_068628 [Populus x canadensis]
MLSSSSMAVHSTCACTSLGGVVLMMSIRIRIDVDSTFLTFLSVKIDLCICLFPEEDWFMLILTSIGVKIIQGRKKTEKSQRHLQ